MFKMCTMKKCFHTKTDLKLALPQIRLVPIGPGLPTPAVLLFNRPIRGIMPINFDYDENYHDTSIKIPNKSGENDDCLKNFVCILIW